MKAIEKLISIASEPLAEANSLSTRLGLNPGPVFEEIQALLDIKNGFVAFESALVVFPATDSQSVMGIDNWNEKNGWRRWYSGCIPDEVLFFAEDIFGGQFGATGSAIFRFNPETGELTKYADSLSHWAELMLTNYAHDTGWPLAHEWQLIHGPISPSQRLMPKRPFVLGGDYDVENLLLIDGKKAMENWGRFYQAIRAVPHGEEVALDGWLRR